MFFINGVFFQNNLAAGIGYDRDIGSRVMLFENHIRAMFHGVIVFNGFENGADGLLLDQYGKSFLFEVEVSNHIFSFKKRYSGRTDVIEYSFNKKSKDRTTLVGTWKGDAVGEGVARCVLTEVPDDFFNEKLLLDMLNKK